MAAPKKKAVEKKPDPTVVVPMDPDSDEDVTSFALDDWIDDAKLPQRSIVVYRRADLRSELDEIEREIELGGGETSQDDMARWQKVARQIADSAVTITVRAMTDDAAKQARADAKAEGVKAKAAQEWDAEGYEDDVRDDAGDDADIGIAPTIRHPDGTTEKGTPEPLEGEERDAFIRRRVIEARRDFINARWIQAVGEHLLVRLLVKPKMTIEQVRSLSEQIGSAQRDRLMSLPQQATQDVRPANAPFSQPSSPGRRGGTSGKRSGQQGRGQSPR